MQRPRGRPGHEGRERGGGGPEGGEGGTGSVQGQVENIDEEFVWWTRWGSSSRKKR